MEITLAWREVVLFSNTWRRSSILSSVRHQPISDRYTPTFQIKRPASKKILHVATVPHFLINLAVPSRFRHLLDYYWWLPFRNTFLNSRRTWSSKPPDKKIMKSIVSLKSSAQLIPRRRVKVIFPSTELTKSLTNVERLRAIIILLFVVNIKRS